MKALILGASGNTGRHLVKYLLNHNHPVHVVVRSQKKFHQIIDEHPQLTVSEGNIHEFDKEKLTEILFECSAVASCLGHNMTFQGIYGKPKLLVTEVVQNIYQAITGIRQSNPLKFVLMNTAGNQNRNLNEHLSISEKIVLSHVRKLVPPHVDNEKASEFLRKETNPALMQWVVVRPDTLIDSENITPYLLYESPTRSALFNPGKTSRINVGNFMGELIQDSELWKKWNGKMPVIYNDES